MFNLKFLLLLKTQVLQYDHIFYVDSKSEALIVNNCGYIERSYFAVILRGYIDLKSGSHIPFFSFASMIALQKW